jgi:serpin B
MSSLGRLMAYAALVTFVAGPVRLASAELVTSSLSLSSVVDGSNEFALDLFGTVSENGENIVISPFSIYLSLSMTYAGAAAETGRQMEEVLRIQGSTLALHQELEHLTDLLSGPRADGSEEAYLHIVNSLWAQTGHAFRPEFLETISEYYSAELENLDFTASPESSAVHINRWADESTMGRIPAVLPPGSITQATRLVLASTAYFTADWGRQFDPFSTTDREWYLPDGNEIMVPTMYISDHFNICRGNGYRAVELPYRDTSVSMLIVLPDSGMMTEVEAMLSVDFIREITSELDDGSIHLRLPKFSTEASFELKESLMELGMIDAFGPDADFSGMDGTRWLYVSGAYHQGYVAVDEFGTEAAGASSVVLAKLNGESGSDFFIDRPFIFLIRDRSTGIILFMGRIMDPRV